MLAIGLMSGTSADGIDAALVELEGAVPAGASSLRVALRAFLTMPYPEQVRNDIFTLFDPKDSSTDLLCRTSFVLGELFARAALAVAAEGGVSIEAVGLIASHGAAVWHQPKAETIAGR